MISALIKGKLSREQENMEDLVTSMVFDQLRYASYASGLGALLEHADEPTLIRVLPDPADVLDVDYAFWPWLNAENRIGCEPDVLISIRSRSMEVVRILIEAKFWAGKSSIADNVCPYVTDQLAREWLCLVRHCQGEGGRPLLVYLTNHHGRPRTDIDEAEYEFRSKMPELSDLYPLRCAWLSWRHLSVAFDGTRDLLLMDLQALAQRLGFSFFKGISPLSPTDGRLWAFRRPFEFSEAFADRVSGGEALWSFSS